tara:strand:+ start:480 stop:1502 length:1023 start_codon:yes stop_codon:yes gene_type:complete
MKIICDRIQKKGFIGVDEYIEIALYDPEFGFYSKTNDIKTHFTTAPILSPWFSYAIAKNWLETFPDHLHRGITEWGAGRGDMMYHTLRYLNDHGESSIEYVCVEQSLQACESIQKKIMALPYSTRKKVHITNQPVKPSGIIFANEFLDALPFKRFKKLSGGLYEEVVFENDNVLSLGEIEASDLLNREISHIKADIPDNYSSEICLHANDWFEDQLKSSKDTLMVIADYGYTDNEFYHPDRANGTYKCFKEHNSFNDLLKFPGECDITAHVNFSRLIDRLENQKYRYRSQKDFLLDIGITAILPNNLSLNESSAIKTLVMPGQMGDVIKVLEVLVNSEEA